MLRTEMPEELVCRKRGLGKAACTPQVETGQAGGGGLRPGRWGRAAA